MTKNITPEKYLKHLNLMSKNNFRKLKLTTPLGKFLITVIGLLDKNNYDELIKFSIDYKTFKDKIIGKK
jgi:hypothetical protein